MRSPSLSCQQTRIVSRLVLVAVSIVAAGYLSSPPLAADEPTNVLFIAIDDLRTDLGCYGNPVVHSPHLDQFAQSALVFDRAYCQQAVCNPSRASLLTGLRLDTLRIWDLPTHFRQRIPDVVTLPQLFKQNGYHTQCVGKIFHNWRQDEFRGDQISWSVPEQMHYNTHGNDHPQVDGPLPPDQCQVPKCEMRDVPDEAYFDGRVAALAVEALDQVQDRPFFLAVGFWKPHSAFNAPRKYWDLYDRSKIHPAASDDPPADVPEIALHNSREILNAFRDRPAGRPTPEEAVTLRHGYYANIAYMDAQVGKVLEKLDQVGQRDNTIVVIWSDHGFHLGEHGLWAKTSNFELDARVPLMIRVPRGRLGAGETSGGGMRTDALVELLDLYPTLADLCELDPPDNLAGLSLRPVLSDPTVQIKDAALTQHCRPAYPADGENPEAMGYSIRTPRYRYTEWRDFETGQILARELYDHQVDPGETVNIAGDQDDLVKASLQPLLSGLVDR